MDLKMNSLPVQNTGSRNFRQKVMLLNQAAIAKQNHGDISSISTASKSGRSHRSGKSSNSILMAELAALKKKVSDMEENQQMKHADVVPTPQAAPQ